MQLRLARPVTDLARAAGMYASGMGLSTLDRFIDHEGFDGVMLGTTGAGYHFEFTYRRRHPIAPSPTAEDLIVLYIPDHHEWVTRCRAMEAAGFRSVPSVNPYWDRDGRTFEDPDGYRTVIQLGSWDAASTQV